ncbi:thioredoxin family protein [Niabella insulamsoli]|uniref:thioredoxin family protein n=1 Tax=Niabella insulamsoli TaxID=3144874 RepID=UPI0031FD4BA4
MIKHLQLVIFFSFISFCAFSQQSPPAADEVLQKAFSKAKAEKKNVFLIFHASWCGWCRKMDLSMSDSACKRFFNENYVIEHLTILESKEKKHLENPGAEALFKKYAPEGSGIPFWIVYDADGKRLGDATMSDGKNAGCPAAEDEISHLLNVLKKSSKIDGPTSEAVFNRFRKNDPSYK